MPSEDWGALQSGLAGQVLLPGSPCFEQRWRPFNARFRDVRPQAVVSCATAADVVEAISFARSHGLAQAARNGGHCFAGHSTTTGMVIDVGPLDSVSVSGEVVTVGAGARLGGVYEALDEHGLAIPAGTCPLVGVAGLTLGGGLGILGRKHGVTSDRLIGAQIVLADGRLVHCDEGHDQDLFWALRGAGAGNFGVVTSLVFRPVPAPRVTNFHLTWAPHHSAAIIEAWQRWAPVAPDELAASLKVTADGDIDREVRVDVYGAFMANESDALDVIDQLVRAVGVSPAEASLESLSFAATRHYWAELGAAEAMAGPNSIPSAPEEPYLFTKSEFFHRPLPYEAITALVENLAVDRVDGETRELDFMPWGGAYNRVPADATAFVHRRERFLLKHSAVVEPTTSTEEKEVAHRWVTRSWELVHPWGSGRAFQNFADPELEDWAAAYYGENYQRLLTIKARYDPDDSFRFDQSLPLK